MEDDSCLNGKTGRCFHPDSKFQGALPSERRTPQCSWQVLVVSRRREGQAQGPSWWRSGRRVRGGCGAGGSLAVARSPAFSGCGAVLGCPRTDAPGPAALVLKKDDLRKGGRGRRLSWGPIAPGGPPQRSLKAWRMRVAQGPDLGSNPSSATSLL